MQQLKMNSHKVDGHSATELNTTSMDNNSQLEQNLNAKVEFDPAKTLALKNNLTTTVI
jgi:hypothetical protein